MVILNPESSENNPMYDSNARSVRITPWRIEGAGSSAVGRGGMPKEIEDREKKTVVW